MTARLLWIVAAASMISGTPGTTTTGWEQWGGPNRNFAVTEAALASSWPSTGPTELWRRPLGDGFSGIVTDGTVLFTTFRDGSDDVAAALRASDGATLWSTKYPAPFNETCSQRLGAAPRAAPLIAGDRVVTATAGGSIHSFDRRSGKKIWSVELVPLDGDAAKPCGYSTSPLQFEDMILTMAGGKGRGVVALDAATGKIRWASQDFENGYSSPILIDVGGRTELVTFTAGEVSGLDPRTGALHWSIPHPAEYGVNVAMPIWTGDGLLFVSSAYNGGSRVLRLARTASGVSAEELWATKRVRVHFGNAVRIGDRVYLSNGDFGAAPFSAVDVKTGEMVWRDRAVARASLIAAGEQLIILDETGLLVLAKPSAEGLNVLARAQVFNEQAWTAPTLSGTRLFLRDRKEIVALEIGAR